MPKESRCTAVQTVAIYFFRRNLCIGNIVQRLLSNYKNMYEECKRQLSPSEQSFVDRVAKSDEAQLYYDEKNGGDQPVQHEQSSTAVFHLESLSWPV
jgi:hypothetical protein